MTKGKKVPSKTSQKTKAASTKKSPTSAAAKTKAAGKGAAVSKASAQDRKLAADLSKLVKQLDKTEIAFLIKQAKTMLSNKKVRESIQARSEVVKTRTVSTDILAPRPLNHSKVEIVQAKDKSSFVIVIDTVRNFMSRDEMRKLVKLCHAAEDANDGASRLFIWMTRNRTDIIKNSEISGSSDEALKTLWNMVVETYTTS